METCCELCVVKHSRCWSKHLRERERVPRVKSPLKLREPVDETSMLVTPTPTCSHFATLPRHSAIQFKDKSERSVLPFCFVHILWSFVTRSAFVPLQSVAIPETVLTSLSLRHYKQVSSGLNTLSSQSYSPSHACAPFCICRALFRPRRARYTSVTFICL